MLYEEYDFINVIFFLKFSDNKSRLFLFVFVGFNKFWRIFIVFIFVK